MSTPALAALVRGGDAQTAAVPITDLVFMARDISNAYLVTTAAGDLMVNTGFMDNAARISRCWHRPAPGGWPLSS
jgi:hypothetical protein